MNTFERFVKECHTSKFKEIIEVQADSYAQDHIDDVKDELAKRGVAFSYNPEVVKNITELDDEDLKSVVEEEWEDYRLETLEVARQEYLKRGFKNERSSDDEDDEGVDVPKQRYPTLRGISTAFTVIAWIYAVFAVGAVVYLYNLDTSEMSGLLTLPVLVWASMAVLFFFAASETIKLFIDIEANTRRLAED